MRSFHDILFVSRGTGDESGALRQALSLARNSRAVLRALILCPELPKAMAAYQEQYRNSLLAHLQEGLRAARESVKASEDEVPVRIALEAGGAPAIRAIREVLRASHDLLIKEAEPLEGSKGFKSVDMDLLRQCPCPVWLCRPIERHREQIRVAVAVDPEEDAPEGRGLSLRLLDLARQLADDCSGELDVISCWNYPYEEYLRGNVWIKVSDEEIDANVLQAREQHRAALKALIAESGIEGRMHMRLLHGVPGKEIPACVKRLGTDILVMGTVARTGIHSFVIGNTAENILQELECSLLALKPSGFVSPVKPR